LVIMRGDLSRDLVWKPRAGGISTIPQQNRNALASWSMITQA
jgi:hypothetical protein